MKIKAWLERHVPGFANLKQAERDAIGDFSFLWSLFEHEILNDSASAQAIVDATKGIPQPVDLARFQQSLLYFRQRYYDGRNFTPQFEGLRLRANDNRPLVEKAISGMTNNEAEILASLLIIVFRFRNNLFHGVKWAYQIRDQFENFTHANLTLMNVMDLHHGR